MPQYEVVRLGGAVPVCLPEFGVLAGAELPEGLDPKQFAVRPVRDMNWRERERMRFEDGTYKRPPWPELVLRELEYNNPDHFLHVSVKDPTKVSFTETPEKGEVDRQCAPMAPGRYLERFARSRLRDQKPGEDPKGEAWMEAGSIRTFAAMLLPPDALKFARTPDEIEHVYVNGPNSCMSGAHDFSSEVHPTRVYGAGDLAVAYFTVNGEDITARCLVWPDKKRYGRPYGDEHRLVQALKNEGYQQGSLVGAKLLRIEEDGKLVCPYIDRHYYVQDHGDHLTISDRGIRADGTDGYVMRGTECACCGEFVDDESMTYANDEPTCESCISEYYFWCNGYDEYRHRDDWGAHVENIGDVCQSYLDNHCFLCERTDRWYLTDAMDQVHMANGETWSARAFERDGGTCERTDENHPVDELIELIDTGETVSREWAQDNAIEKDGDYYAKDPGEELEEAA